MATGHTRTNDGPGGGLCLLSVDGGGVRGLSSLYLLEQLMESVNKKANNDPPLKPYEYFDMIGGTSTGGIIAIMLGRLRMSIRDCIDAYIRLSDKVFKKIHYSPVSWKGRAQGRFDHKALETAIKDVVISAGLPDDALLKDDRPDSCKVFVCALSDRLSAFVPFTSYRGPRGDHDLYEQATIIQACRATSAASTFFDPITIALGPPGAEYEEKFIDGALGYNNPIRQLWTEAGDIWGGPLERKIDCLVSLGTGKPALGDFGPGVRDLGRRLLGVATETQQTADQFYNDRRPDLLEEQRYYRFNVDRGLTNIGLEEAQKKATIIRATKEYLRDGETFDKMRMCVGKLASRQLSASLGIVLPLSNSAS
ncbi:phospholipase [Usnea florida]